MNDPWKAGLALTLSIHMGWPSTQSYLIFIQFNSPRNYSCLYITHMPIRLFWQVMGIPAACPSLLLAGEPTACQRFVA